MQVTTIRPDLALGLHLIAESARMAPRELDRLEAAAEKGRACCRHRSPLAPARHSGGAAARRC